MRVENVVLGRSDGVASVVPRALVEQRWIKRWEIERGPRTVLLLCRCHPPATHRGLKSCQVSAGSQ